MVASREATRASVWPCTLVEHEAGRYSITCTELDRFEHLAAGDAGGYFVERLATKLARDTDPSLLRRVKFDSEAGMFCAFSQDLDALHALAALLRAACGDSESEATAEARDAALPDWADIEEPLLRGFVTGLDPESQTRFLERAPLPRTTREQAARIDALASKDPAARAEAARRVHGDARTRVFAWGHYLAHPNTTSALMTALACETDKKARRELLTALAHTCSRHLPDLRARPHFEAALADKDKVVRFLGVLGSMVLVDPPWSKLLLLARSDRAVDVRVMAIRSAWCLGPGPRVRKTWIGDLAVMPAPRDEWLPVLVAALADPNTKIRTEAVRTLQSAGDRRALAPLRDAAAKEEIAYVRDAMELALEKLNEG